jgi:hypothetical protein
MNKDACEGTDGTSGCITTDILRSRFDIVCDAAKNFEMCPLEYA